MNLINTEDSVVLVHTNRSGGIDRLRRGSYEWVVYHTVTGLESDLGLEGVLTNRTNHL